MKTNYLTFVLLMCATFVFAQNNDFNNQGGDFVWSNPANWSLNAVPVPANTVRLPVLAESQVDANYTITKIQTVFATSNANPGSTVGIAGTGTLTIDAGENNFNAIENVSNHNVLLTFKGNVSIDNSAGGFTQMRSINGPSNAIKFDSGSTLTLTTNLATINGSSPMFEYNGTITGDGNLRFGPGTINTFGSTASNPNWNGDLAFLANAQATVNTDDNNIFYSGNKIQANGSGSSIEINGENVFASSISVGGSHSFTFNVNANQDNMNVISFSDNGTLNLVIDPSVTVLSFADNSDSEITNWNNGTVNIVGYEEGVIRFGTDNTALTAEQLTQIVADNGDEAVALDPNGFLVNESSLSVKGFENTSTPILVSTITTNQLNFTKPQESIKVIDINGKVLINERLNNQLEMDITSLKAGNYFVIFNDKTVERFLKN